MPDQVTNISEVKTVSDGNVTISIEKYNELLAKAAIKPPVITRTTVIKTPEMVAKEYRVWGGSLMGLGATIFSVGVCLYRAGMK
jgi:hypothetical protein